MSSTDSITVTALVAVDPQAAFEVFTTEVDRWWHRGPRFRFLPEVRGKLRFEPFEGGRFLEEQDAGEPFVAGTISTWKPPECLVFGLSGRNGEETEVEVRFEAAEGGTRVSVEHRGFDAIPADHPARHGLVGQAHLDMMGLWWADLLTALRQRSGEH